MGSITTGIGLVSGIDTATLIENLIALESGGRVSLQNQVSRLQSQQTALLDINARLLNLYNTARGFRQDRVFRSALATTSDESVLTATAGSAAAPGTFKFIVKQLVSTSAKLSKGYATPNSTPVGLQTLSFELGQGSLDRDFELANLNGGAGVDRGTIIIKDRAGNEATIDLTDAITLDEVVERINDNGVADVAASVEGDHLVITDQNAAPTENLTITSGDGDTTAEDLGIAGDVAAAAITGTSISYLGGGTALSSLNDGNGVLIRNSNPDLQITARDGTSFGVDLGRADAPIDSDTLLSQLNNGSGVEISADEENADIKFVARDGTEYEVSLTGVTTIGQLQQAVANQTLNGGTAHLSIGIHPDGDKLTVTDNIGGGGNLQVLGAGANGNGTAEDLGILQAEGVAQDSFDGAVIPNTVSDPPVTTIQGVIDRINGAEGNTGLVEARVAADGVSLEIEDLTGASASDLIVASTSANPYAARDLGIEGSIDGTTLDGTRLVAGLNSVLVKSINGGAGLTRNEAGSPQTLSGSTRLTELFNGSGVMLSGNPANDDFEIRDRLGNLFSIQVDGLETVGELIDTVNTATGGAVVLSINGQRLQARDYTGGTGDLRIRDRNGAQIAQELGIAVDGPFDLVVGNDTMPVYEVDSTRITITNRDGVTTELDVAAAESFSEIIDLINASGAGVTAALNTAGNALVITDTTGGTSNLRIEGVAAGELGISADIAAATVKGTNLQLRYVSESSRLADLNYGRGVGTGTIRITDGTGTVTDVNIGSDAETLYDVLNEISAVVENVSARINDNGDGIIIESTLAPGEATVKLKVASVNGTVARDLDIVGESETLDDAFVEGSYEAQIEVEATDSLAQIAEAINAAGIPVSASLITTGSGPAPHHLYLTSGLSGRVGELIIDTGGVDLGFTTLAEGRDAKVFFGADTAADGFLLTSPSNSITDVIEGVTLDLVSTSDDPVTISVARDREAITASVSQLATTINDVLGVIDQYDFFNLETEERGPLLGSSVTSRIEQSIYRTLLQRAQNVSSSYQYLGDVGFGVNGEGQVTFDEEEFLEAYADNPNAVESLFASFEATAPTTEEIAPGVTVSSGTQQVTTRGFGDLFAAMADRLTNSLDGTLTVAGDGLEARIDLLEDRIELFDERLDAKRLRLQSQFAAMELALSNLSGQGNALAALNSNIALAQSLG